MFPCTCGLIAARVGSNALRFGATYCASSANIRARNSTGFFLLSASMPSR
jgi:hypothetical protein